MTKELNHKFLQATGIVWSLIHDRKYSNMPQTQMLRGIMMKYEPISTQRTDVINIFPQMIDVIVRNARENESGRHLTPHPYWQNTSEYRLIEVFSTTIQFSDEHRENLSKSSLPPEQDVVAYTSAILAAKSEVGLPEQLQIALKITGGNLIGAANLLFIASRIYARDLDRRAYANITPNQQDIIRWDAQLVPFQTEGVNIYDTAGDMYYFWTQFFIAVLSKSINKFKAASLRRIYQNGHQIMYTVKRKIAHQKIISEHYEASRLGWAVGLEIAELFGQH